MKFRIHKPSMKKRIVARPPVKRVARPPVKRVARPPVKRVARHNLGFEALRGKTITKQNEERIRFQLFRFQILPINRTYTLPARVGLDSLEALEKEKNNLFAEAIRDKRVWTYKFGALSHKIQVDSKDHFLLRLGVRRSETLADKEFTENEYENWPNLYIAISNLPTEQIIGIQKKSGVFQKNETVIRILEDNINPYLSSLNLKVHIHPIVEQNKFWDVVRKYENEIIKVTFEIITPNMASLSEGLTDSFKQAMKQTNSQRTQIEFNSDNDSHLELSPDNKFINSLVTYVQSGCGNFFIKIKKTHKIIRSNNNITETSITDYEINVKNENKIEILRRILNV